MHERIRYLESEGFFDEQDRRSKEISHPTTIEIVPKGIKANNVSIPDAVALDLTGMKIKSFIFRNVQEVNLGNPRGHNIEGVPVDTESAEVLLVSVSFPDFIEQLEKEGRKTALDYFLKYPHDDPELLISIEDINIPE